MAHQQETETTLEALMEWTLPFYLNIRQKVILGLSLCVLVIGAVGGISYRYLREVERKQHIVEIADDLSNVVLEIRRYEKNYLLYGAAEDLQENRRYIEQGMEVLNKISPEMKNLKGASLLNHLGEELLGYSRLMEEMPTADRHGGPPGEAQISEQMREHGKTLVDFSQQLVQFERQQILNIINTLKAQLLASLGIFLVFGGFLIPIVTHKIIRPLRVIEKTTLRIAQGDFRPLPVQHSRDETQRVVEAFNLMIGELEKRQDQLLQAKKLASLGTLTSGVAHQLNNPLNNISTSCQILLEELDQAEREFLRKMLTNIEQEVYRARDIVRGLLEFARVKEFCLAPVPLSRVVERSVSLISSHVPPGIEIIQDIPEGLSLNLDAQRMQQVLLNLIENGIHAIKSPPGQIKISAKSQLAMGQVVITVEDTGSGISEQNLGRVFDPFFTTKDVGLGTGLGLSIVYGIIEKHRGSISLESKEGEGTRFTIRLPLDTVC
jgi:two-component system, NtrC family, sensor kinase